MKIFKTILSVFLVVIIAIGVTGCMKNNSKSFVFYLENKYPNDSFEFENFQGGTLFGGDRLKECKCKSEKLNENIYVVYDNVDNEYSDNYLDIKYSNDTDDTIFNVLKTVFPNEKFIYDKAKESFNSTTKSSFLQSDIDFSGYKSERGIPIYAFVTNYDNQTRDEIVKNLEIAILKENIYCDSIEIYFVDDYNSDIESNNSLQNDIVANHKYDDYLLITMIDDSGFSSVEWESN